MEIFEVIKHTHADNQCFERVVGYPIKGKEVIAKGFGVTPYDKKAAIMQMRAVAEYWGNTWKTPICHIVLSFTRETAPTAERALELALKIFAPYIPNHQTLVGVHHAVRKSSDYHVHVVYSPTNFRNGAMMRGDNTGMFPIAQSTANLTGQACKYVVKPEDKTKKEYHTVFYPKKAMKDLFAEYTNN